MFAETGASPLGRTWVCGRVGRGGAGYRAGVTRGETLVDQCTNQCKINVNMLAVVDSTSPTLTT